MHIIPGNQTCPPGSTIIINEKRRSNGLGTAGFVLAVIGLFVSWIPVLGWVVWALGLIFSFFGIFKSPRGLAVAGFIISVIDLLVLLALFVLIGGAAVISSGMM